jgi:3-isopropylmalate/(R)-2-methylmalate dehydratase small subunit
MALTVIIDKNLNLYITTLIIEVKFKSSILLVGDNFGCGSSREHAPWALKDFGVKSIISTSFADIFYNNCFKNGILPITLNKENMLKLMNNNNQMNLITIDLESQKIIYFDVENSIFKEIFFEIDSFRKHCLLNGLDDIGLTMQKLKKIEDFEIKRTATHPWLDNAAQKFI